MRVHEIMLDFLEREMRRPRMLPPDQTAAILSHFLKPEPPPHPEWHPTLSREIL